MSTPLVVSIPHRLSKDEAVRRIKYGLGRANTEFGQLLSIENEVWSGDAVSFTARALGQSAAGTIRVEERVMHLEVALPWLLAKLSGRFVPTIRDKATLLLK
jgi:hypothetical protein